MISKKKNLKNGSSEAWLWEQQPSGWETSTPQSPRTSLFLSQMKLSLHLASAKLAKTKNGKKEKSGCALSFPWYSTKQSSKPARKKSHGLIGCQIFSPILYSTAVLAGEEEEGAYITQLTPKTINLVSWKEKLSWSTVRDPCFPWSCGHHSTLPPIRGVLREPWKLLFRLLCGDRVKMKHHRFITNGNAGIPLIFMADVLLLSLLARKMDWH